MRRAVERDAHVKAAATRKGRAIPDDVHARAAEPADAARNGARACARPGPPQRGAARGEHEAQTATSPGSNKRGPNGARRPRFGGVDRERSTRRRIRLRARFARATAERASAEVPASDAAGDQRARRRRPRRRRARRRRMTAQRWRLSRVAVRAQTSGSRRGTEGSARSVDWPLVRARRSSPSRLRSTSISATAARPRGGSSGRGMYEAGVDLVVTPYRGRPVESPWWRAAPNPTYREGEAYAALRGGLARLKGDRYLRRAEASPEDSTLDRLTRETIWRVVTPRWRRHLERLRRARAARRRRRLHRPDGALPRHPGRPARALRHPGRLLRRRRADEPARVRRHGHGLQLLPRRRPVRVRPRRSRTRREGLPRLLELGARRAEAVFWAADPEFFAPQPVEKETDVFFYGYGDKFRREWMAAMVGEPSRRAPEIDFALGGRDFRGDVGRARGCVGDVPVQRLRPRDLGRARQPQHHAPLARDRSGLLDLPAVRARRRGRRDRLQPARGHRARGSSRAASWSSSRRGAGARRLSRAARRPGAGGGDGRAGARARARRAHLRATARGRLLELAATAASVPAVAASMTARRRVDRRDRARARRGGGDRRSRGRDPRARRPHRRRRRRRRLGRRAPRRSRPQRRRGRRPAAVQPRHRRRPSRQASATPSSTATTLAVRLDGDGQHDPAELPKLLAPVDAGDADIVDGLALRRRRAGYRPPLARRAGIVCFARLVSLLTRQRVTDTTSGFQALNRRGIALFAARLPERLSGGGGDAAGAQAQAAAGRGAGADARARGTAARRSRSCRSVYYMLKVTLALFVAIVPPLHASAEEDVEGHDDARHASRSPPRRVDRPHPRRARADPRPAAEGALRAALARHRGSCCSCSRLARRAEHDRRLARGRARYPPAILFAAATLFVDRRAPALLDGALAASDRNVVLAQRVALLEERLQALAAQSPAGAHDREESEPLLTEPREQAR